MNVEVADVWSSFRTELRAFISKRVQHHADPDDVLQDVFIQVIQNKEKLEAADNLRQYLYAMVRNAVNDVFRKTNYETEIEELNIAFEEERATLNQSIAEECIRPIINFMPTKYKQALIEVELNNKSQKELAEKLGISYSALKSRVQRGRAMLKETILCCCIDGSDKYGNLMSEENEKCDC